MTTLEERPHGREGLLARAMKPSRPWGAPTGRGSSPLGRLRAGGEEVAVEPQFHRRAALGNHLHVEVQRIRRDHAGGADVVRSEEHTTELQSLMRISYAAFCLKKKTKRECD